MIFFKLNNLKSRQVLLQDRPSDKHSLLDHPNLQSRAQINKKGQKGSKNNSSKYSVLDRNYLYGISR
jgi:hypothetical protein